MMSSEVQVYRRISGTVFCAAVLLAGLAAAGHWHRPTHFCVVTSRAPILSSKGATGHRAFSAPQLRAIANPAKHTSFSRPKAVEPQEAHVALPSLPPVSRPQAMRVFAALPMSFEANTGQSDPRVRFLARAPGYTLFLTDKEAVLSLPGGSPTTASKGAGRSIPPILDRLQQEPPNEQLQARAVRIRFVGSGTPSTIAGRDQLPGKTNYFIGNDPKQWHTNVPNYSEVEYRGLYPGVDAVFHGDNHKLEFDFDIAPGADPHRIALQVDGARRMRLDGAGNVLLDLGATRAVVMGKPRIYQRAAGGRRDIAGHYVLSAHNRIAFALDAYDRAQPLVIDPTVDYATYLGGSSYDYAEGIAVDSSGSAYIAGFTSSTDFPTMNGYASTCGDCSGGQYAGEGFVAKLNSTGSALVYSTYLSGVDIYAIAVDRSGSAYVAGGAGFAEASGAPGLPVVNAFQSTSHGSIENAFVTKLGTDGSSLVYSTYLGGDYSDEAFGVAVDFSGSAYVTGLTNSSGFPTKNPIQASCNNCAGSSGSLFDGDAFVTKFSADGSSLVYSTYLGGSQQDVGQGIAVDSSGSAYVTGLTQSSDFPTMNPFQPAYGSSGATGANAFVSKLSPDGSALVYSTYLGGAAEDYGIGIAVDSASSAYVTGLAQSHNFPVKNPHQATMLGANNAFVTKFNADGIALVYSTYLGGDSGTQGSSIAVDAFGNAYVTGPTTSNNFPLAGATQTNCVSCSSYSAAFVSQFNATGSALLFSTYLGGSNETAAYGIGVDPSGDAYVAGLTKSADFPTVAPFQSTNKSSYGTAFVAKYSFSPVTSLTLSPTTISSGVVNGAYSPVNFTATGATGTVTFAVTAGSLPTGLALTPAGALSGTPVQGETFSITVTAADTAGDSGSQSYSFQIACPAITVGPATLPTGTSGTAYTPVTFTETGGFGAATFAESGALPTGISFATPVLSGTPTVTGTFPIQVTATDAASCTGSVSDSLTVYPVGGPPAIVTDNETVTMTDADSMASTIADNETVTVTDSQPSTGGTGTVTDNETVTVTDDSRAWVPIAITLTPAAFNASDGTAIASASYGPVTFTATGGTPPLVLTESGTLPAGLTFNNGVLGGTLSSTSTGVYTFSVTAADNYGDTPAVEQGYTLNIGAAPPIPSYKVTANPDAFSVAQGETGTTTLTFTPSGGYTGTLALGCSGLPAYSQCVFTQNGATVNSAYLSGNNQPVGVVLTFETDVNSQLGRLGSAPASTPPPAILPAIALWWPGSLFGLIAFIRKLRTSPRILRWLGLCLLALVTGAVAIGLAGCGGKSGSGAYVTPVGTSTVTVSATATSGTAQTLSIDITVTQ